MDKKKVLLCVTGGIAAFKAIDLASQLVKLGFEVKAVLTENALKFVTELNFKALTNNTAHTDLWTDADPIPHIHLADRADLVVVAPATANLMAKAAHGIADDLVSTVLLAHTRPVLWVPAMNVHMYGHPATQENVKTLRKRGNYVLEPATGLLACGYEGRGKFPPVEEVVYAVRVYADHGQDLAGRKILISAGGTSESIDPMRFITNRSSGKTALALARAAALRGAEVHLVHGNITEKIPYYLKEAVSAPSAAEMKKAVDRLAGKMDIIIMAAAVSDFSPVKTALEKIKKSARLTLEFKQTEDILAGLGKKKKAGQKLIGFAAETEKLLSYARGKLQKKNLDLIVANLISVSGRDDTEITLLSREGTEKVKADKFTAAHQILDKIISL